MSQRYEKYYESILNDNNVPSIVQNKVSAHDINRNISFFPKCEQQQIPQFFKSNLVSPNRIIKYVYGEYCVYRAFYFQLLKLMFQIEDQQRDYVEIFKEIIFDPEIIQRNGENSRAKREMRNSKVRDHSMSEISEQQGFRREFQMHQKCVAQFIEIVLQNSENFSSFEQYLPFYPQIDQSISFILQTFIDNAQENMDSIQSILEYLSELFEIQLVVFENCFKFQQSDVFLFIEQKDNEQVWVFIAYNENEQEEQENGEQNDQENDETNKNDQQQVSKEQNSQYDSHNGSQLQSNLQNPQQSSLLNPNKQNYDNINASSVSKNQRSSSHHSNVITSQSKPQLSNQKPLQNYPQNFHPEFQNQAQQNYQNSPSLVSSSHSNIHQERPFDSILYQQTAQINKQNNTRQQGRDFHKKYSHYNQQQNLQHRNVPQQLSNLQSYTETYHEDHFNKTPQMNQQSFVKNTSYQNSTNNKIENNYKDRSENKRVTDSKSDTIINMFGDMLGSTANIGSLDHSQKIINGVFGSVKNIANQEPQRDNDTYYRSITKKNTQIYGSFNTNNNQDPVRLLQGNAFNMKKVKIEKQFIFEAKPSSSYAFEQNQTKFQKGERTSFQQRRRVQSMKNNQILIDSEQLRQQNGVQRIDITRERNSSFDVKKSGASFNHHGQEYFDNIEARSYRGQQKRSNRDPGISGSFHNSNPNSINSKDLHIQAPNININSARSQSQTSSIQLNNRNNYYRQGDEIYFPNRPKQHSTYHQKQKSQQRQLSIKSEEHNPNINNNYRNLQNNKTNQYFEHEYKSQQYVTASNSHQSNIPKPPSKAYTYNIQPNKPKKIPPTQNTQQEDDFFFHPKNQTLNYGLKTIKQVRASKQTNRQSYIVPQNQYGSKISHGNSKISENDQKYKQTDSRISQQNSRVSQKSSKLSLQNQNYNRIPQNHLNYYEERYQNKNAEKQIETIQTESSKFLSKVFNTKTYETKKPQAKQLADDSINNGTFYKQFTNSKVLKLLKQPYRTKVQILRNRFKGEHRATINKFIS